MTPYDAFTTEDDLASRVAALEVRALARVIGKTPERENWPELTTRELAREVIEEAARLTCAKQRTVV